MKKISYIFSFICLLVASMLFYERSTWTTPSAAMMNGNSHTEYFLMLTRMLTGININHVPRHDNAIAAVNIISSLILFVAGFGLFLFARRKR
jgi:hypothetical protein